MNQRITQSPQKYDSNDDLVPTIHIWVIASNGDALYRYCLVLFAFLFSLLIWNWYRSLARGFMFCFVKRNGVSARCPEGDEWIHVKSDAQFQSISIGREPGSGGCIKVWAISKDGVAYLRHGVSDQLPTGVVNLHGYIQTIFF